MSGYDSRRWCRHDHRWQAVPDLRASNRECLAANTGAVNWKLDEMVAARKAKLKIIRSADLPESQSCMHQVWQNSG